MVDGKGGLSNGDLKGASETEAGEAQLDACPGVLDAMLRSLETYTTELTPGQLAV